MGEATKIEWTDATWNPVTGCTKVSPGCDHCYAEGIAERFRGGSAFPNGFDITIREKRLTEPMRWAEPKRVFVNSMSDLFHEGIPDDYIARVFATMAVTPRHTYQVLTKRHGRMKSLVGGSALPDAVQRLGGFPDGTMPWPLPNVWLGVSVEDQKWARVRVHTLLSTPAAVRFLSCEPLLGPVALGNWLRDDAICHACPPYATGHSGLDWVIVGGESGRGSRPMEVEWVRALRDECVDAGVPFFFKQWGEFGIGGWRVGETEGPLVRMGKRNSGREIDRRTWDEYPGVVTQNSAAV